MKTNFIRKTPIIRLISTVVVMMLTTVIYAQESIIISLNLLSGDSVDIRQFKARGNKLLIGFACDEGTGQAEINTASVLAGTNLEIWMPDLLTAHFLPKLKSSIVEIPTEDIVDIINMVIDQSDKDIYLISSGPGSALLLRGLAQWEQENSDKLDALSGVLLLYPRLNAKPPEPGKEPVYIDAVGRTKTSIVILEGARTPNSWALPALKEKLSAGGSLVTTALIPGVRGFFYQKEKPTLPEEIVTFQLAGLVRASLIKLDILSTQVISN